MDWLLKIKDVVLGPPVSDEFLKDKRNTMRVNCSFEAEFTDESGSIFPGRIIVIEHSGMRCAVPYKLNREHWVKVTVREFSGENSFAIQSLTTKVVWCRRRKSSDNYCAGLLLVEDRDIINSSWVNFVMTRFGIADEPYLQRRKVIRVPARIKAVCYHEKYSATEGEIEDIGLGGIRMNISANPGKVGEVKLIIGPYKNLRALECQGRIVRKTYNRKKERPELGIKFTGLDNRRVKALSRYVLEFLKDGNQ